MLVVVVEVGHCDAAAFAVDVDGDPLAARTIVEDEADVEPARRARRHGCGDDTRALPAQRAVGAILAAIEPEAVELAVTNPDRDVLRAVYERVDAIQPPRLLDADAHRKVGIEPQLRPVADRRPFCFEVTRAVHAAMRLAGFRQHVEPKP